MASFNPRVRAGRDLVHAHAHGLAEFQSTRPRGTRPRARYRQNVLEVSIHASARDATSRWYLTGIPACFNPRVRAGRDQRTLPQALLAMFQSTRPRGLLSY